MIKGAEVGGGDHPAALSRPDTTMRLAKVNGADPHREAARLSAIHDELTDLFDQLLLNLQSSRETYWRLNDFFRMKEVIAE